MAKSTVEKRIGSSLVDRLFGTAHLFRVSLRRLFFSRQTMVNLLLLVFAALVAVAWSMRRGRTPLDFVEQILLPLYVSFLLPMFCLCYGAASIASEREDKTLVYVLTTPLPRPMIFVAKYAATLLLCMAWTIGGLAFIGRLGGAAGWDAFERFWWTAALATTAYVGLFHFFSVTIRRATIVGLAYALFLETFLGNMPGIVKRVAITFYTQCHLFESATAIGMDPSGGRSPALFLPVTGETAAAVLLSFAGGFFLLGMFFFSRREYA